MTPRKKIPIPTETNEQNNKNTTLPAQATVKEAIKHVLTEDEKKEIIENLINFLARRTLVVILTAVIGMSGLFTAFLYGVVRRMGNNTRIALIYWSKDVVASSIIDSNTKKRDICIPSGGDTDVQCLFNKELQNVDEQVMALLLRRPQTFILTDGEFGNFNVYNDYFNKATWLIHSNTNFDSNLASKLPHSKVVYLDYL